MWYPRKAAFRAGNVDGIQWNDASIGNYSIALGQNTTASGINSTAFGVGSVASGPQSTAFGNGTLAQAYGSTSMGVGTIASWASTAIGTFNTGLGSTTQWNATDPLFEIGNGTSASSKSNALTVFKNGNMQLQGNLTINGTITSAGSPVVTASASGVINLPSSTGGMNANEVSIFSLGADGKVNFASSRPLAVTSTAPSSSSNSGALTVAGGLGVASDGNIGGALKVAGSAHFATAGVSLTGLPAGVTGTYYGPITLGTTYINDYVFQKSGDETTGDFFVPIGIFGNGGGSIEVSISGWGSDPMAGAAYYSLGTTRYGGVGHTGQVTALQHLAFGAGCNAKLFAFAKHGYTTLYLQLDARTYGPGQILGGGAIVKVRSSGSFDRNLTPHPIGNALPLKILNSTTVPYHSQTGTSLLPSVSTLSSDETIISGKVTISTPQGDISMGIYQQ